MNIEIIYSVLVLALAVVAVFVRSSLLDKVYYLFLITLVVIILNEKGISYALLFLGVCTPLLSKNKNINPRIRRSVGSSRSIKEKIINYLCFAPLIGLAIMSYKIPIMEANQLSPLMIILGEVSLVVVTFLVMIPKRLKVK
ncbi:MAG: hypothetical protein CME63_18475 [Halobacteriovoraceae bacterium]|nr:hypothetical protein [Halobacteriovoraceae bacterium]|tara:strand:+ start:391 stop:813 length:423 start_codon:yes stop_codon:yes gene_type:complete